MSRLPTLRYFAAISLLTAVPFLSGCTADERDRVYDKGSNFSTQDRELGYSRDDYRNTLRPRPGTKPDSFDKIPDLAPVISEDRTSTLPQPLVSITVNQDVPIREIFFELAKQAEVDLELDPTITGSVIFTAYNRPFDQVVERICDMAGLRYQYKKGVLRVERDTPYVKTYHVGYLSVAREYTSTINSNTSASSSGGGGGTNGSNSVITSKSTTDFWNEFENNITQLIRTTNQQVALTDQSAPIATAQAIPAINTEQLAAMNNAAGQTGTTGATAGAAAAVAPAPAPTPMPVPTTAPVAGLLNPTGAQSSVASGAQGAGGQQGGAGGTGSATINPYFSVNRQAGLVSVFASEKQHKRVQKYISDMMGAINTQVLIEAKVFEVELSDENSLGIDWSYVGSDSEFGLGLDRLNFTDPLSSTGGVFQLTSGNLDAVVTAISRFGTVRALSSPRLSVMNNQTAVLNVSESRVFFNLKVDRTEGTDSNPPRTDITTEISNVPEGLILTVHPSVDPETNEITMNLRPSITRVVRTVRDPGLAYLTAQFGIEGIDNLIPELSVREIDSMVRMNSGKTIIMGGLMQDRAEATQQSVPVLGEIPLIGSLFRAQRDTNKKTEMVIMLKATVANAPEPDTTDKEMYKEMGQDRHPFNF